MLGVSMLQFINVISLLVLLSPRLLNPLLSLAAMSTIGIINYIVFLHRQSYKLVQQRFQGEENDSRQNATMWTYVIVTYIVFFSAMWLLILLK